MGSSWIAFAALLPALAIGGMAAAAPAAPRWYFVALNGNDAWSGRQAAPNRTHTNGPFATLERARDEIRRLKRYGALPAGGITVEVRGGLYQRERPFELTAEDSGTAGAPIVYRAYQKEAVRLVGGKVVTGWKPVTDPPVLRRLDPAARGHVLQADLRALGITGFGSPKGGGLELFFQERPMTLARWPNEGFVRIVDVVGGSPVDIRGTKGDKLGKFVYEGDRPKRWLDEKDVWLHGYWFWDWSDDREKVESIDPDRHTITLAPPYHSYGYRKGQWYYAFNILAELDQPGEWYLDRDAGLLYFWPPASIESGAAIVSVLPTLITMNDAAQLTLRGMTLEAARGTAVTITGGVQDQIAGCTIRNVGGWAVKIAGGTESGVTGCEITGTGDGGIALDGGDRKTLTPARLYAENNHIHDYARWDRMYQPAISIEGDGNRAAHNLIHDAPHEAIAFGGNDHVIELNEIHHVCTEANDAGAIYSGRDWTMRGTTIRFNFLHQITGFQDRGSVGVYLDDMFCGTTIFGNVFDQVTRAAFIGGGRDNTIENNIFVDCRPAVHVDARALGWAADTVDTTMKERLLAMPYQQPLWSERYPKLVPILDQDPAAPRGNVIARNIITRYAGTRGGQWEEIEAKARPGLTVADNLLDQDPHFVDAAKSNFQLRPDSPAYRLGFQRIPFEKIGLLRHQR